MTAQKKTRWFRKTARHHLTARSRVGLTAAAMGRQGMMMATRPCQKRWTSRLDTNHQASCIAEPYTRMQT